MVQDETIWWVIKSEPGYRKPAGYDKWILVKHDLIGWDWVKLVIVVN